MTLNKILKDLEKQRLKNLKRNIFKNDDDVGYYDYDENDDWSMNTANKAFYSEALNSCWNKSR
jgi:hypothetical protein